MTDTYRPPLASVPRALAVVLAGALLATIVPLAGTARAADGEHEVTAGDGLVPTVRFAGENRFDTAQLIATEDSGFEPAFSGETLIVATGDKFPDALAGSSLGGSQGAPIALTPSTTAITPGVLDADLAEAIEGVTPETIYILGESAAVSTEIEDIITEEYGVTPTRIGGENRYETAALLAAEAADDVAASETRTAIVARADDFPDALVAGSIAAATAAAGQTVPILLTDPTGPVNPFTVDALTDLDIERVIIAGGTAAISDDVADELGIIVGSEPERVSGPNRYSTATAFAALAEGALDDGGFGFGTDHVNLATGQNFPDALALGPHAGLDTGGPAPILLTEGPILGEPTTEYLESIGDCDYGAGVPGGAALHAAGGTAAIPGDVLTDAREALTATGDACAVELTPESATNLVGAEHVVTAAVVDNAGDPVDQALFEDPVTVTFTTAESGTASATPESATVEVADDGTATFAFTSELPADVTVTAEVTDSGGVARSSTATKTFALPADDETVFGVTGTGPATFIYSSEDGPDLPVTGVGVGETIVGLDFRPFDRRLWGISDAGVLYRFSGGDYSEAEPLADLDDDPELFGDTVDWTAGVAFDFNPDVDRIRVVTADGTNLVVDPNIAAVVAQQPDVVYGDADGNAGLTPAVTAAAYDDVEFGDAETATPTRLFVIDTTNEVLANQSATGPTAGELTSIGDLDDPVAEVNGFDVSGNTGIAYAALDPEGEGAEDIGLYVVDLTSGGLARLGDLPPDLSALAVAPRVRGETALALQGDGTLVEFTTTAAADLPVTRTVVNADTLAPITDLVGLDYRDATGELYALGENGQLYRMAVPAGGATVAAEPLGDPLDLGDLSAGVGLDFNPAVDLLRVVTAEGGNYRLDPESATVVTTPAPDGDLAYAAGDISTGATPEVTAAAYANNVAGTTSTTLFDIDTAADNLVTQAPPNDGTLNTVGPLGFDATEVNGFDVSGVTGDAFGVLDGAGLYRVDLFRGGVTFVGGLPTAPDVVGFTIVPEFTDVFDVALSSADEVPPVTDADASGDARLRINLEQSVLCATLDVDKGVDDGLFAGSPGAHIHEAPAGSNGPIVQFLPTPSDADGALNGRAGGCLEANGLLDFAELVDAPEDYYVNVHTTEYPAGIARGQLAP